MKGKLNEATPLEGPVTMSNDIRPLSNRGKCHFRGSSFQNFPGGACPRTPLVGSHHVSRLQRDTWRDQYFLLATPLHATKFSLSQFNTLWSAVQSKLPKNIFNFTIRYINNTLPTRKNLVKWNLVSSLECSFCLGPETLLHVVAGCQHYLERFTWRHDSILNFLGKTLQSMNTCQLFADLSGFQSPSIITGDSYRPDILLITPDKTLYVVELTVGFETNLHNNVERKIAKYKNLIKDLSEKFLAVKFINLSISSLGVWDKECSSFLEMLETIGLDKRHQQYSIKKITSYAIRATYYIFCCRNKEWTNPELLNV